MMTDQLPLQKMVFSSLTQQLWETITPLYQSICKHPFIEELAAGTLDKNRFIFYLQQDALYLVDFARALAHTATRLKSLEQTEIFLIFAQEALVAERELHKYYFKYFNVKACSEQQPACFYYTNYLLATVNQKSVEEAVAALLPCFWIYAEVGQHIANTTASNNIYHPWIAMYSSDAFHLAVKKARDITDHLATEVFPANHELMKKAFVHSARLEWLFWDSAYKLEQWCY